MEFKTKVKPASLQVDVDYCGIDHEFLSLWLCAIKEDDVDRVRNTLIECDFKTRTFLLHELIQGLSFLACGHSQCDCYGDQQEQALLPKCSLGLALYHRSAKVTELLMTEEKIHHVHNNSMNAIQYLLYTTFVQPWKTDQNVKFYDELTKVIPFDDLKALLMEESHGSNALEISAIFGLHKFFLAIFNTTGVYLMQKGQVDGGVTWSWYDVTDYEGPDAARRNNSPLNIFTQISREDLFRPEAKDFFESLIMKKWFERRHSCLFPLTVLSISISLLAKSAYGLLDFSCFAHEIFYKHLVVMTNTTDVSQHVSDLGCLVIPFDLGMPLTAGIFIVSSLLFFLSIYMLRSQSAQLSKTSRLPYQKTEAMLKPRFFTVNHVLFELSVMIRTALLISLHIFHFPPPLGFMQALNIVSYASILMVIIYFLGFSPVGHNIVSLQQMTFDFFGFLPIFLAVQGIYAVVFYLHITRYGTRLSDDSPDFNHLIHSFYSINKLMVHSTHIDVDGTPVVAVLHVIYIISVSILLLNLVIALFSQSVSMLFPIRHLVLIFQRQFISTQALIWNGFFLKFFYRRRAKQFFAHQNGRLYLVVLDYEQ